MDTLSKDFLQELECPVCMEYMLPPITLCENGHSVCNTCRQKLHKCPVCKGQFMKIRNLILESLAGKVHYPCKFQEHGCQLTFQLEEITTHQQECLHGHYKCPFFMTQVGCTWDGPSAHIVTHIKTSHTEPCDARKVSGVHKARLINFEKHSAWCQTVFTLNQVFFRFSKVIDGFLYSCVLYVGPKENACKYNYRLTVNTPDGKSSVSASHRTEWYDGGVDGLFEKGKCAVFHNKFATSCMTPERELILEEEIFTQPI